MNKNEIRCLIRARKQALTRLQLEAAGRTLGALLYQTAMYQNAAAIYGYLPCNQEVRTIPMLRQAMLDGKRVAVPKCCGKELRFIWLDDFDAVAPGYRDIPEPIADAPIADDPTALVLVPGLAFDSRGHRIGYGGGFYDRFLQTQPHHPTVALCYDFQMFPHLEVDRHDIPVDQVLWARI